MKLIPKILGLAIGIVMAFCVTAFGMTGTLIWSAIPPRLRTNHVSNASSDWIGTNT
jgi:hypothetical protein